MLEFLLKPPAPFGFHHRDDTSYVSIRRQELREIGHIWWEHILDLLEDGTFETELSKHGSKLHSFSQKVRLRPAYVIVNVLFSIGEDLSMSIFALREFGAWLSYVKRVL